MQSGDPGTYDPPASASRILITGVCHCASSSNYIVTQSGRVKAVIHVSSPHICSFLCPAGEDAVEDEAEENPIALEFQQDREAFYIKDPKKALQGFFDREGMYVSKCASGPDRKVHSRQCCFLKLWPHTCKQFVLSVVFLVWFLPCDQFLWLYFYFLWDAEAQTLSIC